MAELTSDPDKIQYLSSSHFIVSEVNRLLLEQRSEVLELESQEENINMHRVDAYREKIGAPKKEIRVLSDDDYEKAIEIAKQSKQELTDEHGQWLPLEDLIIVKRGENSAVSNELTESFLVHEIAHSSSAYSLIHIKEEVSPRLLRKDKVHYRPNIARAGFATVKKEEYVSGIFLEEGYAEYERGQYIANELNRPYGFYENVTMQSTDVPDASIALKYFYPPNPSTPEAIGHPKGATAAIILELLVSKDPKLLDSMRHSRSSVEGLRDVAARIDKLVPGLYDRLRKIDTTSSSFNNESWKLVGEVHRAINATKDRLETA